MDKFTQAYLECALWSSLDDDEPMDKNYEQSDFAAETLSRAEEDCLKFQEQAADFIGPDSSEQAGHDFWLTRNRHGCGFWSGGWSRGVELTGIARGFSECSLYVGDDGKIYMGES